MNRARVEEAFVDSQTCPKATTTMLEFVSMKPITTVSSHQYSSLPTRIAKMIGEGALVARDAVKLYDVSRCDVGVAKRAAPCGS